MKITDSMLIGHGESGPGSSPADVRSEGWKVSTSVTDGTKPYIEIVFSPNAPIIVAIELPVSICFIELTFGKIFLNVKHL